MAKIWCYAIIFYSRNTLNHLQKPIRHYVREGSNFFFFSLQATYLPNPRSSILMPKPPCLYLIATDIGAELEPLSRQ